MINGLKFAAIDIGSNAVRLLLSAVFEMETGPYFRKMSLIRMPIRLGEDAFMTNEISPEKVEQLIFSLTGFKYLMAAFKPLAYSACATSAMRDAKNGEMICRQVHERAGIAVEIIDGREEAGIIFADGFAMPQEGDNAQIYLDVGGGSTEITIFSGKKRISRSFNIGTIRLLNDMVTSSDWEQMRTWIKAQVRPYRQISASGSGGNIHKLLALAGGKERQAISADQIKRIRNTLQAYTVTERVTRLGLKPDRADVILPAIRIYLSVMNWGNISAIKVPQMGLADGLVQKLYREYKKPLTEC